MFFPIGQPCRIGPSESEGPEEEVLYVTGNRTRTHLIVLTASSIYVYHTQPGVLLSEYRRTDAEVKEKGEFVRAYWQFDGAAVAVSTTLCHLLIFSVDCSERSYVLLDNDSGLHESRPSRLRLPRDGLPSIEITLIVVVNLVAPVTCAVAKREELFICGRNGFSHHIKWNGEVDNGYSFLLSRIPFTHDQLQSKPAFLSSDSSIYVRDCAYAPLCGGYALVLSDGRAALLTSNDPNFHPNSLLGVWAMHLKDAVCTDTNHRFRLLLFGCGNGDVAAYHQDETSGGFVQTFRTSLSVRNGPELGLRLGAVREVKVLPQNGAVAVVWDTQSGSIERRNGGLASTPLKTGASFSSISSVPLPATAAIFSPLGSQIWCSLESRDDEGDGDETSDYRSIEWGPEGYQLWMGGSHGVRRMECTRSAAFNNPYMEHSERIVLIGSQRLHISPLRSREADASAPHSVWTTVELRGDYLNTNWPIRFASLDREEGRHLVAAGTNGISFCSLANQRWKIFGNESQERALHVTGGVFVWRGIMVGAAAENAIKMYPVDTRLDESLASTKETDARIIMINVKGDQLVTLDIESRLLLYTISRVDDGKERDGHIRAHVEKTAEIRIGDMIPHIVCLVSIHLTLLNYDNPNTATFVPGVDTVLLNVSGRLITLSPKNAAKDEAAQEDEDDQRFQLSQPLTIASFVEQVWHDRAVDREEELEKEEGEDRRKPLRNAVWINCGARGSHVWLALFPGGRGRGGLPSHSNPHHDSFISRRIMLPFKLEIYPALICSEDCIAVGVESTPSMYGNNLVLYTPHRNSEVFIHHLLRQLLKRNLGLFALELAESFRSLPYFTHSLELLLHNVLEEEATSAEPIPDPLLPFAVAFIQQFPEFLRTVAHCARKTELALWPTLFEVTGPPNDLFEVCLRDGQLETAASYLIILQNMENATISLEQSAHLLREALTACSWNLARDLVRFARSIDADDMECPMARSPPLGRRLSRTAIGAGASTQKASAAEDLVLARFQAVAGKANRIRHSHSVSESGGKETNTAASRKDSANAKRTAFRAQSSELSSPPSPSSPSNPMLDRMHRLIHEHAARLLEQYCVRDFGCMCAHLEMDAPSLLSSLALLIAPSPSGHNGCPSLSVLSIGDFPLALQRVHSQFEWPYPVASNKLVDQLAKRFAGIRSSSSAACLSDASSCTSSSPLSDMSKKTSRSDDQRDEDSVVRKPMRGNGVEGKAEDEDTDETIAEVVAVMQSVQPKHDGVNGGMTPRSISPSASSFRTSTAPLDDLSSLNGCLPSEPLLSTTSDSTRGDQAREAQLRHMIGVFAEINAIDWVFLLCIVLRDASTARASLSVAAARRAGSAPILRLRSACSQLKQWAQANCLGYVQVVHAFEAHLTIVSEALGPVPEEATQPNTPVSNKPSSASVVDAPPQPSRIRGDSFVVPRSRALRDAFVQPAPPGGAVRGRRERSRSVGRVSEEAVSNVTPQSNDCSIM